MKNEVIEKGYHLQYGIHKEFLGRMNDFYVSFDKLNNGTYDYGDGVFNLEDGSACHIAVNDISNDY